LSFVAECFWIGVSDESLRQLDERAQACVAEMQGEGEQVVYRGSVLMRADEVVLCFFEGTAVGVRRAAERAGIPFERIVETTGPTGWMAATEKEGKQPAEP
jgi:hypothetical protein